MQAALLDAERIKKERESTLLDLNSVGDGTFSYPAHSGHVVLTATNLCSGGTEAHVG